ncbi:Ger(x)C family spore germination protein [Paenibacillus sp. JX-17]|uniref:Ger(X)C family spore germination protein n=1 Tax=Paenibacillus lacisoli TaxID=3064525 RepID=A0ABT9CFK5_9BACL|nr:Ger(x)C family spore germination protein [Paenibacillus sp. JX-17]MDO7908061.1 Ger(x)C family spore germination protein [Paenibacillus sp. JX-17]
MLARRVILAWGAAAILLLQTGCWSSKEIENLSVYVGVGLDVAERNEFEQSIDAQGGHYPKKNLVTATVQIVPGSGGSTKKESGSSAPSGQTFLNEQLTGDSLFQIFRQFAVRRSRPLIGHHLKVIVVSDQLARKYGMDQLLDFILRDNDIRPSTLIVVSHGKANQTLSSKDPSEVPAFYLRGLMQNSYRTNKILKPMSLAKLDAKMQSNSSFMLQNVLTSDSEHKLSGAGVFNGKTKKLIGTLNQTDLEGISWITGTARAGPLKTYDPRTGQTIVYEIHSSESKIIPTIRNGEVSFHVKMKTGGQFMEDWSIADNKPTEKNMKHLQQWFEEEADKQINEVIQKLQKEIRADVVGFGDQVRIKYPRQWKKLKDNWDETFAEARITYDFKLNLEGYGSITE